MFFFEKNSSFVVILIISFVCKEGEVVFFKSHSNPTKTPIFNFCHIYFNNFVFHLGQNAIDQGTDGKRAAEQMGDLVSKCSNIFKPHKVSICQIPQDKNGLYRRDSNNNATDAYNQEFNSIADQIRGKFQ